MGGVGTKKRGSVALSVQSRCAPLAPERVSPFDGAENVRQPSPGPDSPEKGQRMKHTSDFDEAVRLLRRAEKQRDEVCDVLAEVVKIAGHHVGPRIQSDVERVSKHRGLRGIRR